MEVPITGIPIDPRSATSLESRCYCKRSPRGRSRAKNQCMQVRPETRGRMFSLLAVGRNVELKWIRVSSLALRWMLAASLTASPLLAEQSLQSDIVVPAHRPVVQVLDENNNPMVGTSILSAVLMDSQGKELASSSQDTNAVSAGQIATERAATELGAAREPAGRPSEKRAEPGGKTWSDLLIAALIAGGVVALILLLRGGHDKPGTAAAPHTVTGTILAPGTPS